MKKGKEREKADLDTRKLVKIRKLYFGIQQTKYSFFFLRCLIVALCACECDASTNKDISFFSLPLKYLGSALLFLSRLYYSSWPLTMAKTGRNSWLPSGSSTEIRKGRNWTARRAWPACLKCSKRILMCFFFLILNPASLCVCACVRA